MYSSNGSSVNIENNYCPLLTWSSMVAYEYVIVVSMYDVLVLTAQVGEPVIHSA